MSLDAMPGGQPAASEGQTLNWRHWAVLAVLCTANFMVILDGAIVFIALPSIAEDLSLSTAAVQWTASGYLLCFGALLLLGGRASDLIGSRRMFIVGVGLFVVSSLFCGLAWSGEVLITARLVQGVSAAIMTPTALSILLTTFAEGAPRNKALGVWTAVGGVGGTAGVLIGGPITEGLGWEWLFLINVVIGIGMLACVPLLRRDTVVRVPGQTYDVAGAVTVTGSLALLVYAVVKTPENGWLSGATIGMLAASVVLMATFIRIEQRSKAPLVPLRLFRSRSLVGGNLVMLCLGMTVFACNLLTTLYAQSVLGYSALEFGFMTAVMTVMAVVGSFAGQAAVAKIGVRALATGGLGLMTTGALLYTQISADGSFVRDLLVPMLIFGTGLGSGYLGASIAGLSGIANEESGLASGVSATAFQLGGALGLAVVTTVIVAYTSGPDQRFALTNGFQAGYLSAAIFGAIGVIIGLTVLRMPAAPPSAAASAGDAEPAAVPAPQH